jgi:hypothetical protein
VVFVVTFPTNVLYDTFTRSEWHYLQLCSKCGLTYMKNPLLRTAVLKNNRSPPSCQVLCGSLATGIFIWSVGLCVPHGISIKSPLWAQQVHAINRIVTMVYINITITILHIIHFPVFYLKHNSTIYVCLYLTGSMPTLRFLYEPNRLMLSIDLWRWYINITTTILDIIHRPVFYLKLSSTL